MFGIENIIVALWFLPVTLCIIVPLVMFAVWHAGLGQAYRKTRDEVKPEKRKEPVAEPVLSAA